MSGGHVSQRSADSFSLFGVHVPLPRCYEVTIQSTTTVQGGRAGGERLLGCKGKNRTSPVFLALAIKAPLNEVGSWRNASRTLVPTRIGTKATERAKVGLDFGQWTKFNFQAQGLYSLCGDSMALDPQITGNVGLYYCCFHLSLLGWNVMPTARNARGVDIVAYSRDGKRFVGVQVKALSKRNPVPLGKSLDSLMGDFWIVVNRIATTRMAFILLPTEVKRMAHRGEKDGRISYWLQPPSYDCDKYREAWHRIGTG